jgi:uncharacterized flavoprotein (TIGR03862 family)
MAGEILGASGVAVTVFERMPSVGRKFLLAGRGGLNLTHSEPLETLISRYREAAPSLRASIEAFPPEALRAWCEGLGQPTFIGSSGRIFPEAMKASPLLRAWLRRQADLGVVFRLRHRWDGWDENGRLLFTAPDGRAAVEADATVLTLGGASWPHLGSDGSWTAPLREAGIEVVPLKAANCGFLVNWSEIFARRFEGEPLKNIRLSTGDISVRGEALITRTGLQGTGIYALGAPLREAIDIRGEATLRVDLRPDVPRESLEKQLAAPRGRQSLANVLRKATKLSAAAVGLLHEASLSGGSSLASMSPAELASLIKSVPVRLTGTAPIARAISTAGGIAFSALDESFMLKRRPGVFVAGEMLDWEAPTGGYLLQACFSTGVAAARGVLAWLAR